MAVLVSLSSYSILGFPAWISLGITAVAAAGVLWQFNRADQLPPARELGGMFSSCHLFCIGYILLFVVMLRVIHTVFCCVPCRVSLHCRATGSAARSTLATCPMPVSDLPSPSWYVSLCWLTTLKAYFVAPDSAVLSPPHSHCGASLVFVPTTARVFASVFAIASAAGTMSRLASAGFARTRWGSDLNVITCSCRGMHWHVRSPSCVVALCCYCDIALCFVSLLLLCYRPCPFSQALYGAVVGCCAVLARGRRRSVSARWADGGLRMNDRSSGTASRCAA